MVDTVMNWQKTKRRGLVMKTERGFFIKKKKKVKHDYI